MELAKLIYVDKYLLINILLLKNTMLLYIRMGQLGFDMYLRA